MEKKNPKTQDYLMLPPFRESWAWEGREALSGLRASVLPPQTCCGREQGTTGTPGEMQEERTENRDRGRIGISQHEVWGVCLTSSGNQNCSPSTQTREN